MKLHREPRKPEDAAQSGDKIRVMLDAEYPATVEADDQLTDLLTDVRHFCDEMGISFHAVMLRSAQLYADELPED